MHISPGVRWVLRIGTAITLAFIYIPLIVIAIYAFNESRSQAWPIDGFTLEWFDRALNNPGVRDAFWTSMKAAARRHGARSAPRHARRAGGLALPLLRPRVDLVPDHPAARAARHRDRHGAQLDLHAGARNRPVAVHRDRRARHLLHRRGLQQRGGPAAAQRHVARGGVHGPGRERLADVPPRDLPDAADCARGRGRCWRSRCRSTRSSSPPSRSGTSRRCRSGSSPTTRGRTSSRS